MGKKFIAGAALAALLAVGLGAALAAPGTPEDPFVTLSYLTDTYYAQAEQAMLRQAQAATANLEKEALARLEELAGNSGDQGGLDYAEAFTRTVLSRGDKLELPTGASLVFEEGQGALAFTSGTLVDVTGGVPVTGGALTPGHRYVAAENTLCTLTALTDAAILSVQGSYTLTAGETAPTPFTDLAETDWYYPYARYAYEENLFQGVTATRFSPGSSMTRAMLATVLSRMSDMPESVPDAGFTDVPAGSWYAAAVNWAAGANLVNGVGDGLFAPDSNITREQMATLLYRYAGDYLELDVSDAGDLSGFADRVAISSWAEEALAWAVGAGLMNGFEDGTIAPGGTATRAEVAALLQRFAEAYR